MCGGRAERWEPVLSSSTRLLLGAGTESARETLDVCAGRWIADKDCWGGERELMGRAVPLGMGRPKARVFPPAPQPWRTCSLIGHCTDAPRASRPSCRQQHSPPACGPCLPQLPGLSGPCTQQPPRSPSSPCLPPMCLQGHALSTQLPLSGYLARTHAQASRQGQTERSHRNARRRGALPGTLSSAIRRW